MTLEDKKILNYLVESYDKEALLDSIDTLNEYLMDTSRDTTSSGQTRGMQDKGVKGLLRAAPSAILSTAIFWPGALIALVGALSIRAEKHWLRSVFNNDNWLDYLSRPYREKWEKKDSSTAENSSVSATDASANMTDTERRQVEKQMVKENMKTYYAVLSNGEIFRVRALTEDDARKQVDKIIEFNPYEEMQRKLKAGGTAYMIYLNDFEQVLWCAANADAAKREVMMSRRQLDQMYQKVGVSDPMRLTGLKVDDVQKLKIQEIEKPGTSYRLTERIPLSDRTAGERSQEEYYTSQKGGVWTFKMRNSNCIFTFPARSVGEANQIAQKLYIFNKQEFKIFERLRKDKRYKWYKVTLTDGDVYILAAKDQYDAKAGAYAIQQKKYNIIGGEKIALLNKVLNNLDELPEVKKIQLLVNEEGESLDIKWTWGVLVTKSITKEVIDNTPMTIPARRSIEAATSKYVVPNISPFSASKKDELIRKRAKTA